MAISKPDPATAGMTHLETEHSKEQRRGKEKAGRGGERKKGKAIIDNMPQALQKWCLSQHLPYKPCDVWGDPVHGQSLSRVRPHPSAPPQ